MSYAKTFTPNPNALNNSSPNRVTSFNTPTKNVQVQSPSLFSTSNANHRTAASSELRNVLSPSVSAFQTTGSSFLSSRQNKLNEVHQKYEREAQQVQQQYVQHYQESLTIGNSMLELQNLLDMEVRRTASVEEKLNETYRVLEQERRNRLDGDRENKDLREKLRRQGITLSDYELKLNNVQINATSVGCENDGWKLELKRLNEACNAKLKEMENKHASEVRLLGEELEELRSLIKDREIDNDGKIRGVTRELEQKIRSLENHGREKDRIIVESESELKSLKEFNMKVKMEFEEEIRKRINVVKDDERTKYETTIKALEGRIAELENEAELLRRNMEDVGKDVRNKEGIVRDSKMKYEDQVRSLRREIIDLKDKMSLDVSEIERLQSELRAKDPIIVKLQLEIQDVKAEMSRHKEAYGQEVNRLAVRNDNDVRKFQEFERQLKGRITELERLLKNSESEVGKLKTDLERLRQNVAGNIQRSIAQTFVDYGVTGESTNMPTRRAN